MKKCTAEEKGGRRCSTDGNLYPCGAICPCFPLDYQWEQLNGDNERIEWLKKMVISINERIDLLFRIEYGKYY